MKPECSFCDSAAVRESGPDKLVTCYDCHTAYERGHKEGVLIGEQRATAKIVALLRTAVCDDWFEHVGPDSLVSGLIALIENHAGGREGEK